jgi:hypothetical protein
MEKKERMKSQKKKNYKSSKIKKNSNKNNGDQIYIKDENIKKE